MKKFLLSAGMISVLLVGGFQLAVASGDCTLEPPSGSCLDEYDWCRDCRGWPQHFCVQLYYSCTGQ